MPRRSAEHDFEILNKSSLEKKRLSPITWINARPRVKAGIALTAVTSLVAGTAAGYVGTGNSSPNPSTANHTPTTATSPENDTSTVPVRPRPSNPQTPAAPKPTEPPKDEPAPRKASAQTETAERATDKSAATNSTSSANPETTPERGTLTRATTTSDTNSKPKSTPTQPKDEPLVISANGVMYEAKDGKSAADVYCESHPCRTPDQYISTDDHCDPPDATAEEIDWYNRIGPIECDSVGSK